MIPNNNQEVLSMLAEKLRKKNRGRNMVLLCAVAVGIVTLTLIFGTSAGKIQAEYTKAVRRAGSTASAVLENATEDQYRQICSLSYIKNAGKRVRAGRAESGEKKLGEISLLDQSAWEKIIRPAYTDLQGHYPKEKQEIMVSVKMLEDLGITEPTAGMKIQLTVVTGWQEKKEELFYLSGWYTSYTDSGSKAQQGYISEKKAAEWGIISEKNSEILICPSDRMSREEAEEQLYKDVKRTDTGQRITVTDPAFLTAVDQLTGSYEMAVLGVILILGGVWFLIHNILEISMIGDIRQFGLLYTIGTTKKQLRKICHRQMAGCMLVGSGLGVVFSVLLLFFGIPGLLGQEYLREYGGTKEFSVFRPEILIAAVGFTLLIIEAAIQKNMNRMIRLSCIESMHYTGKQNHSRKRRNTEKQKTEKQNARKRRKIPAELPLLAWRNVTRERAEFVLTVLSLFLGVETLLCTAVVTGGSDATNIYMQKPDFILAGDFCEEAKEGIISEPDEEALDPLVTDANTADLLWNNKTDDFAPDFAPISESVRKKILALKGVDQDRTECAEGAYMNVVISEKGWSPFSDEYFRVSAESSDEGETETDAERSDTEMERSGFPETVHILSKKEMDSLKEYAEEKNLSVDMASVEDGSGVLIYQEYGFTPEQKKMTEEVKGEPVSFCSSGSEYEKESAEIFTLNGYLDGRAKDFPELKLGWHGENMLFFLVSEKGFERLGIEKEIIYMEVNVKVGQEQKVKSAIRAILTEENQRRTDQGENGILLLCRSDLLKRMSDRIHGNQMILGSIGMMLLFAGLTNYFNVMIMGRYSRKQELAVMESIGMTKKQKRKMFFWEGNWYFLLVEVLVLTVGTGILWLVRLYMEKQAAYFRFQYPAGWLAGISLGMLGILAGSCCSFRRGEKVLCTQ